MAFYRRVVVVAVGGYRADAIDTAGITLAVNERHAETGELASLAQVANAFAHDTVISYGDLLFRSYIVRDLVESEADFTVVVDSSAATTANAANASVRDFAYCSSGDDRGLFGQQARLEKISGDASDAGRTPNGRWIGLLGVRGDDGRARLQRVFAALQTRPDFDRLGMPELINALAADGAAIAVQYVHGHWRGVNDMDEFRRAGDFAHGQTPFSGAASEAQGD